MSHQSIWLLMGIAMTFLVQATARAQHPDDHLDRSQARSMTITRQGIVATPQVLASQAGAEILARGFFCAYKLAVASSEFIAVIDAEPARGPVEGHGFLPPGRRGSVQGWTGGSSLGWGFPEGI